MAVKPVLSYPNPILRRKALPVGTFSTELAEFVRDMIDTMEAATGAAGIAAPQIGAKGRVVVISKHVSKTPEHVVLINPVVKMLGTSMQNEVEGCLSFYGVFFPVRRAYAISVTHQDLQGAEHTFEASGYYAQAIQHEVDHLEGKLLIDQAKPVRREMLNRKFKKLAGKYLDYSKCIPPEPPPG